jgi:hypothetical protein
MPLRFQCKGAAVALAGTTFNHGLGPAMAAIGLTQPDEWSVVGRGPVAASAMFYVSGTPTSTSIIIAASGAAGTADVFVSVNHSSIR